jgi:ribosomal-protein-alanine N-acetyltransferase
VEARVGIKSQWKEIRNAKAKAYLNATCKPINQVNACLTQSMTIGAVAGTKLRRIRANEVNQCVKILLESEPWITFGIPRELATKAIRDGIRMDEVIVAVKDRKVAGFVLLLPRSGFPLGGYVMLLAVDEMLRGMGIGRILLEKAEEHIFRNWPNVFLLVSSFNTSAQGFYRRLGYKKIGQITDAIIRGHSEFIMRKTRGPVREYKPKRKR